MGPALDRGLAARLRSVAVDVVLQEARSMRSAVVLAEDLVAAGADGPATVVVAALSRESSWSDAEEPVRQMLAEHDLAVLVVDDSDDESRYRALLVAFALWGLPPQSFLGAFNARLPAWEQQTALERELVLLLEDRDHESRPAARRAVEDHMRAAVRRALSVS